MPGRKDWIVRARRALRALERALEPSRLLAPGARRWHELTHLHAELQLRVAELEREPWPRATGRWVVEREELDRLLARAEQSVSSP